MADLFHLPYGSRLVTIGEGRFLRIPTSCEKMVGENYLTTIVANRHCIEIDT